VAGALRRTASGGGAEQLTLVAAGWELAARSGAGLADVVEQIAAALRAGEETRRVVEGELASARATARLVALLPVAALGIGAGAGGDPVGFLLGTVPGSVCLGAGLLLAWVGLRWIDALCEPE
jgi:tight adherence protein B